MKTTITITDIAVPCIFGVSDAERSQKQTILVTVELVINADKASKSDNILDVLVDYKKVYETVISITENSQFHLLETLAKRLVDTFLSIKGVYKAKVIVTKPNRLVHAKGVSVQMKGENE
ncbi:MAG TPA: dihydroneopterin aldolase [Patescibacteria group bacterium]